MIDYETYCKIRDHHDRQKLTVTQTARALGLHPQTVAKWVRVAHAVPAAPFAPTREPARPIQGAGAAAPGIPPV